MSEKKVQKYLGYALGEILLVVIGILIALSINNWNDERKERDKLDGYLATIRKNIESDTVRIKSMQSRYELLHQSANEHMQMVLLGSLNEATIIRSLNVLAEQYLIIDQSGFESLKSSGLIEKLQGTQLEDALFDYYNSYKTAYQEELSLNQFIERLEARLFEISSEEVIDVLRWIYANQYPDVGSFSLPKQKVLKLLAEDPHIMGIISRMADEDSPRYLNMLNNSVEVLRLIDKELKP
jgi:hypothetical protein